MKNLAIITARSGSKGLKDKNIKILNGKPLIAWTIEAAIMSEKFCEIMVSTDSERYAKIARSYGAKVPFLRSATASSDKANSWDVVREVLENYRSVGQIFDSVCLLQPTSPLRSSEDIIGAYALFEEKAKLAVVSVCEVEHPIQWCGKLPEDNSLAGFIQEKKAYQRQKIEPYYRINGAVYIVNVKEFYKNPNLYREGSFAYIMPQCRSVDIDSEMDFMYAELLMKAQIESKE